jgi:hypothetical protein
MKATIRKVLENESDQDSHGYFVRFGKGKYENRFAISLIKGKKIKIKGSYEFANDFVNFVKLNNVKKFSGKVLSKESVAGFPGRKKAGSYVYEVSDSSLEEFENPYFYLVDADESEIVLKIKKSLPKPGKDSSKIDDKFCFLEVDLGLWKEVHETFFWDMPEDIKKTKISHTLVINEIILPNDTADPVKVRELAKRKGQIIRKSEIDGQIKEKSFEFIA